MDATRQTSFSPVYDALHTPDAIERRGEQHRRTGEGVCRIRTDANRITTAFIRAQTSRVNMKNKGIAQCVAELAAPKK